MEGKEKWRERRNGGKGEMEVVKEGMKSEREEEREIERQLITKIERFFKSISSELLQNVAFENAKMVKPQKLH